MIWKVIHCGNSISVIASVVAKTTDSSATAYQVIKVATAAVIAAITSH
jgi:hypothetical protein